MKQNINEVKRMQQLAGVIKESQLNEEFDLGAILKGLSDLEANDPRAFNTAFSDILGPVSEGLSYLRDNDPRLFDTYFSDIVL